MYEIINYFCSNCAKNAINFNFDSVFNMFNKIYLNYKTIPKIKIPILSL